MDKFIADVVCEFPLFFLLVGGHELVHQRAEVANDGMANVICSFNGIQTPVDSVGCGVACLRPITETQRRRNHVIHSLLLLPRAWIDISWGRWLLVTGEIRVNRGLEATERAIGSGWLHSGPKRT